MQCGVLGRMLGWIKAVSVKNSCSLVTSVTLLVLIDVHLSGRRSYWGSE
jgi:hypothetical protein